MRDVPQYITDNYKDAIRDHFTTIAGAISNDRNLHRDIRDKSLEALVDLENTNHAQERDDIFTSLKSKNATLADRYVPGVVARAKRLMWSRGQSVHTKQEPSAVEIA